MDTPAGLGPEVQEGLRRWHDIVASQDASALPALLRDDVEFRSPVAHTPYRGRETVAVLLRAAMSVFRDFEYHRNFTCAPGHVALEFSAAVGTGIRLKGVDIITFDNAGLIVDFEVMVRPAKGLEALAAEMAARVGPHLAALKAAKAT